MSKHPGGRPTKYDPAYVEQVRKLCLLGSTDEEIAQFFGVSVSTLFNWCEAHPEFLEARKEGKEGADMDVARSLYDKAKEGDTTAMIFWLKNRKPAAWRDRRQHELSGPEGGPIETRDLSHLSEDEIRAQAAKLAADLASNE